MARTGRPWVSAEIPGPGVRGLPVTGAHIKAGSTDPNGPGPGVLFVPIPEGKSLLVGAVTASSSSGNAVYHRRVNADGTLGTGIRIVADNRNQASNDDGLTRGILLYFKGEFDLYGIRAVIYDYGGTVPTDFDDITWSWHPGLGHSGCAFSGAPTYVPTNGVGGGMASYSATFREVGDWLQ